MVEEAVVSELPSPTPLKIYHRGPKDFSRPLPALFYFALSGKESLSLDPFNQPIISLHRTPIHSFSFTLPFHGEDYSNKEAMHHWAEAFQKGEDFLAPFLENALQNIDHLINQKLINPEKIAVGGLSRGGFIATHLAARDPRINTIIGFSPLTTFGWMQNWREGQKAPLAEKYDLLNHINQLKGKKLSFYIGNRDTRVGTTPCLSFIQALTEKNYEKGLRSPPVECLLFPSIGHKGHGTPPHIFKKGINWLTNSLSL